MDELLILGYTQLIKRFFDKIFNCFNVVVGDFFNVLDALRIGFAKIPVDVA